MVKGLTKKKQGGFMEKKLKKSMIREAKKLHSKIFPCGMKKSLDECFTITEDAVLLWFNTPDMDTRVLIAEKGPFNQVTTA